MLHAGIDETHLNNVLSALDILPISKATLKEAERKVGSVVESLAKESCGRQLQKECELTQQAAGAQASPNCTKVGRGGSSLAGNDNHDNLTLSPSTIACYVKRFSENYDIPDLPYEKWKQARLGISSPMCVEKSAAAEPLSTSHAPCRTHTAVERQPLAGAPGITVSYDMGWAK